MGRRKTKDWCYIHHINYSSFVIDLIPNKNGGHDIIEDWGCPKCFDDSIKEDNKNDHGARFNNNWTTTT